MLLLGDVFPNFSVNTTEGELNFHEWLGDSWGILFSHPSDFTPVCTTELARVLNLLPEFKNRNVKVIGLSCDSVSSHIEWCKDIKSYAGYNEDDKFPYPIIEDEDRKIAMQLGMVDKDEKDHSGMPLTARAVFIIDSNKKYRLSLLYPATTGRNFDEILRVVDSLQLTDKAKVATPVDWRMGDDCMVLPTLPEDQVKKVFPHGVTVVPLPSGKNYLRKTSCPKIKDTIAIVAFVTAPTLQVSGSPTRANHLRWFSLNTAASACSASTAVPRLRLSALQPVALPLRAYPILNYILGAGRI